MRHIFVYQMLENDEAGGGCRDDKETALFDVFLAKELT
jgi:hypothetical protein